MKKITLFLLALTTILGVQSIKAQTVLFTEDFATGIPGTWQNLENIIGGGFWTGVTTDTLNGVGIATTTVANGYAVFNADLLGNDLIAEDADLITPSFSCVGHSVVNLTFENIFTQYAIGLGVVSISNDNGLTWTDVFTVGPALAQGTFNDNPDVQNIDISTWAANQANVKLRFNYTGDWDYWWVLDDILVSAPAGSNLSLENTTINQAVKQEVGGFVPNFVVDYSERTNVVMNVDIRNIGASSVSSFVIESIVSNQAATVTEVLLDTVTATIASGGVYSYSLPAKNLTSSFPAQATDEVLIVSFNLVGNSSNATVNASDSTFNFIAAPINSLLTPYATSFEVTDGVGTGDFNQDTWGWKYIDNDTDGNTFGPYNFSNIATQTGTYCIIGSIINGNSLSLDAVDETLQSPNMTLSGGTLYDFSVYAYAFPGQTGSIDLVLTDETGSFSTNLGTINVGVNDTIPQKFTFQSSIPVTQNDILVNIDKNSTGFILFDLFEIIESPTTCNNGDIAASLIGTTQNVCPGDSSFAMTDGSESILPGETYGWFFQSNTMIDSVYFVFGPTNYSGDLNADLVSFGEDPIPYDSYTVSGFVTDSLQTVFCGGVLTPNSFIVNFLAPTDPSCSPTACSAGVISTVGFPATICPEDSFTISTDGSESTNGDYAVFFSPQATGTGGLGNAFSLISIDLPYTGDSDLDGVLSGNGYPPMQGEWVVYTRARDTIGGVATICDESIDSVSITFLAPGDPGCAAAVACTPGGLVSASSMIICSTATDSIILDGTESSPGSYSVSFDDSPGGTGGLTGGFSIINVNSFPWVFDNDIQGVLSSNGYGVLQGMWNMTVYNVEASGIPCDSVATVISVNFVDSTSPLCTNPPLSITSAVIAFDTCMNSTGSIDITVTGGTMPYSFAWTGGSTDEDLIGQSAGVYQVTITDANMNTFTSPNYTIGDFCNVVPCNISDIAAVVGSQTACNSTTNTYSQDVTITYVGAPNTGTININGQSFAITSSPQTETLVNLVADGNVVDVTASFSDDLACTMTQTNAFTAPVNCLCSITDVTAGQSTPCNNVTNQYTQDVTVFYANAPAGMLTVNGQNFPVGTSPQTVTLTGLNSDAMAVNVVVSFTGNAACTYSENAVFAAPANCLCPTINVNVSKTDVTNCTPPNGSVTALATGGSGTYTYVWTPGGSGATITGISSGNYSVTATDANGCTGTNIITVGNTSGFTASLDGIPTHVTCHNGNDGVINTTASGGSGNYTYVWSDLGQPNTVGDRSNLVAGAYSIVVIDGTTSCNFDLGTVTITEPDALVASVSGFSSTTTCNGGNDGFINVDVTGGNANLPYTYSWTNSAVTSEDLSNLSAGVYTLTVTNVGCLPTASTNAVAITQPDAINIAFDGDNDVTCNGDDDGNVLVTVTGGNAPLTYAWTNGGTPTGITSEDAQNIGGGIYQLTVTDDEGCPSVSSPNYTIDEPDALVASIDGSTDETCFDAEDGTITASISGGTGAMDISWTNSTSSSLLLSNLTPNSYQLSVTDGNNCPATSPIVTIAPATQITATSSSTEETTSGNDGTATVVASGGLGSYTYLWNPTGQTTAAASGLLAGAYTCTIQDDNGCQKVVTVNVAKATSIGQIALNELMIYPNPSNGTFTVSFETLESLDFEISLFNTIGKEVYNNSFENVVGEFTQQIAVQDLSSGIYFLEISNRDAKSVNRITISK